LRTTDREISASPRVLQARRPRSQETRACWLGAGLSGWDAGHGADGWGSGELALPRRWGVRLRAADKAGLVRCLGVLQARRPMGAEAPQVDDARSARSVRSVRSARSSGSAAPSRVCCMDEGRIEACLNHAPYSGFGSRFGHICGVNFTDLVLNIAPLCLRPNRLVSLHLHAPRPPRSANVAPD